MRNKKRNNHPRFIFWVLALICLIGIGLSITVGFSASASRSIISSLLAPMQEGINSIGNATADFSSKRQTIDDLRQENEELTSQIDVLRSELSNKENNLSEYEDLLQLLELTEKYPTYRMTGARIISKDAGNWYNSFTINKGSLDGLKVDMNVVADNGLVGIITEVNATTSVVRSIIDDASSVSGMISKNYAVCIVDGDLTQRDTGLLNVEFISKDSSVMNGDEVVTSYISNKYLPGILIGYISDVHMDDSELTYVASLTPAVDFQHLSNVLVVKELKAELSDNITGGTEETEIPETEAPETEETEPETIIKDRDTKKTEGEEGEAGDGEENDDNENAEDNDDENDDEEEE